MFEIEYLLMAFVAPFVTRDYAALVAHFDVTGIEPHLHSPAGGRRHRIQIGLNPHAAEPVHTRKGTLCQLEVLLRKRQELCPLRDHRCADGLLMAGDLAPRAISAAGQQLRVELVEVPRLRNRHPVIAPKVAGLALYPAFLVRFGRRAKVTLEAPV